MSALGVLQEREITGLPVDYEGGMVAMFKAIKGEPRCPFGHNTSTPERKIKSQSLSSEIYSTISLLYTI